MKKAILALLLMSCATPPPPQPPPKPNNPGVPRQLLIDLGAGSEERCLRLLVVMCAKAEACGFETTQGCLSKSNPMGCMDVVGIEEDEAEACAYALDRISCDGPFPIECVGMGERRSPEPTHRDL